MPGCAPAVYRRRQPENAVLYEVIRRHYNTFKASIDVADRSLPSFVEREFAKYLSCGILARGFVRMQCKSCGFDRVVAFSCKCRGWCGSCIGRRMADTAAYLTDHVIPDIPMRTWTLTLPHPLRYLLAYNTAVLGEVITAFSAALLGWLRHRAKRELGLRSVRQACPGMFTWVQRFGSAVNLNVHLHTLAAEGVFVENAGGEVKWYTLREPSSAEVAHIAWDTCKPVMKSLLKRGLSLAGEAGDVDELADREPLLAACYAASIQGFIATGQRAGQRVTQMGVPVADHGAERLAGPAHGFNLFAGKCISAFDRKKREYAIRYMARPPLPDKYLSWADNGDVMLQLKRPWSNGTTHMRFTGPELIERLVALVPAPRVNLVRYHGVFAPNARLRPEVVSKARAARTQEPTPHPSHARGRYLDWAELMRRVFEFDVTVCPRCRTSGMQVIACITDVDVIRDILTHIGQPTAPPRLEPACLIDEYESSFDAA